MGGDAGYRWRDEGGDKDRGIGKEDGFKKYGEGGIRKGERMKEKEVKEGGL